MAERESPRAPVSTGPELVLSMLDGLTVSVSRSSVRIPGRKAQALLAYLACESSGCGITRERLCGLLWSESSDEKARASLRQSLHELRMAFRGAGCDLVEAGREAIILRRGWSSDVEEILGKLEMGEVEAQLLTRKDLPEALLPGFEYLDPAFGAWLLVQRQNLSEQLVRELERLLRSAGRVELSRCAAAALLNLNVAHEEACRFVMRDAAERGDVAGALRTYKVLWELLDEEYGTEPSPLTQAVAIDVKTRSGQGPAQPQLVAEDPDKPSLAVLPFLSLGGDPEQEYVADGIVEDITTALSRIRWFSVVARNSSFTYKGRTVDVREVSRDLGVRYVLEGSVRRAGSQLRITVQLIDATTGHHCWADRYDGTFEDVFAFQDQITESVVGALEPNVQRAEIRRATRKPTSSLAAYDLVLQAIPRISAASKEDISEARKLLTKALDVDPAYAHAMALLSRCSAASLLQGCGTEVDRIDGAAYARKAIQLGPDDPLALAEAAINLAHLAHDFEASQEAMARSLALHASSASAHNKAGWLQVYVSRPAAARLHFETAMRLSPADLATCHFQTGYAYALLQEERIEDALEWANKALLLNPGWGSALRARIIALIKLGRLAAAKENAGRFLDQVPDFRISEHSKFSPFRSAETWEQWTGCFREAGLPD